MLGSGHYKMSVADCTMVKPAPIEVCCPHCGAIFEHQEERHQRSVKQQSRVIVLCRALYHHWPERLHNVFIPKSESHLRYWLISQIEGYFDVLRTIRVKTTTPELAYQLLRAVLDESDAENIFLELDGDQIIRKRAKSTRFDKMDHFEATKLFTQIDEVIEQFGLNAEKLLKEWESAA